MRTMSSSGRRGAAWQVLVVVLGGVFACSSNKQAPGNGGSTTHGAGGASTSSGTAGSTSGGNSGLGGGLIIDAGNLDAGQCVVNDPNADMDHDGWTPAQGDCNDCDPNVNPGAIDTITMTDGGVILGNEDCNGTPGQIPPPCDDNLAIDDPDPMNAAKAVELCTPLVDPKKWGIKSAKWVLPDGSDPSMLVPVAGVSAATALANFHLGHGILKAFGNNVTVQAGKRMLGLSSGTAREPVDPGYQDVHGFDKGYTCNSPMGFPKESAACPNVKTGQPHDAAALEVDVVAPTNAHGFSFSFNFFTYEWPTYICSTYNDFFVALLYPIPAGQKDGNISFDSMGNPVSVNNAFLEVCGCTGGPPCAAGGKMFACGLGDQQLINTGFGPPSAPVDHGSTYWLVTKAPIKPHEEITLRWAVYDSSDGLLDTTTLVDNFQWIAEPGVVVGTTQVK